MRIAVITCEAYRDAVAPFTALFHKFWPDCPYPLTFHKEVHMNETWCTVVTRCAQESNEPILMLMEDFFLTAPVRQDLIVKADAILASYLRVGCVRVYPSPGPPLDNFTDVEFRTIPRGSVNRISCQAAIWRPDYLLRVALGSMGTTGEAGDFENLGTPFAETQPDIVMSVKRNVTPWPLEYISSAISRGLWNPDAIKLCAEHGIDLDLSRRPVAAA